MNDELKPCPFPDCAEKYTMLLMANIEIGTDDVEVLYHVWCPFCDAYGPRRKTKSGARKAWNSAKR